MKDDKSQRAVRNHEQQARLNAVKRALAIAREASESKERIEQLEMLVTQLEGGRMSSDYLLKSYEKMKIKEEALLEKEATLLQQITQDDKKHDDLLREARREKREAIAEMGEKNASDQRMREMAKARARRLQEVSLKRAKRLEEIETKKAELRKETLEGRLQQHHEREKKLERITQKQLEREVKLETELAERERHLRERKELSEQNRVARTEATEKQRKEVSRRCDDLTDAAKRQEALQSVIDSREKRIAQFKAQQHDEKRQRSRDQEEKLMKQEQNVEQELRNKIRTIRELEKKRTQRERKISSRLNQKKVEREEKNQQKRAELERKIENARSRVAESSQRRAENVLRKNVETADRLLEKLEELNVSPTALRLPLISSMTHVTCSPCTS